MRKDDLGATSRILQLPRDINPAHFAQRSVQDDDIGSEPEPFADDSCPVGVSTLTERVKLDVPAEYFNAFNHPMFGAPGATQPNTALGTNSFGKIVPRTTNDTLGGGSGGGQSALYALGGPRSAQFTINCSSEEREVRGPHECARSLISQRKQKRYMG